MLANLLAQTFDLFGGVAGLCGSGLGHGNLGVRESGKAPRYYTMCV